MRGPCAWSVGDRELMAAYVSRANESAFCIGAHSATASRTYQDGPKVAAVLADLESAPVEPGLRATPRMLGKLTRQGKVGAEDMRQVLSAGVSHQQVKDVRGGARLSPPPTLSACRFARRLRLPALPPDAAERLILVPDPGIWR
jgi:AhpD family alkylhydroperoxidase